MTLRHRQIDIVCAQRAGSLSDMLAITNTPLDLPIEYAASGRAIYQPHVMQCYLPHEIEPFYWDPAIPVSLSGVIGIANTLVFVAGTPRMSLFIGGGST